MWEPPTYDTFHGMCLSRAGLSIGKYGSVVSRQHIWDNALGCLIVYFFLGGIRFEDFVKQINFTLKQ